MTLGKLFNLSGPWFPHLKTGDKNSTYFTSILYFYAIIFEEYSARGRHGADPHELTWKGLEDTLLSKKTNFH